MNYMEEVAKLLGVELGEYFEIYRCDGIYFLSYSGLHHNQSVFTAENVLNKLLSGEYHIKRKPWKPKYGEIYYFVNTFGQVCEEQWYRDILDRMFYKIGNCYKDASQAEANRDKWITFYASDEVLEV